MAAGRHNLTRRALLGAAAALPLALRGGAASASAAPPTFPFGLSLSKPYPSPGREGEERKALRQAQGERDEGDCSSRARWNRAVAAFRRAEAALAAFRGWEATLPAAARAFPACVPLDERFNDLEYDRLDAPRRLLRAPAPNLPELAFKIELTVDNQAWELTGAEPCLAALKADARRLCGGG